MIGLIYCQIMLFFTCLQFGTTGFLTVEPTVQANNWTSPTCVEKSAQSSTQFLNYISLLGQDFNYADGGGIFYQ